MMSEEGVSENWVEDKFGEIFMIVAATELRESPRFRKIWGGNSRRENDQKKFQEFKFESLRKLLEPSQVAVSDVVPSKGTITARGEYIIER